MVTEPDWEPDGPVPSDGASRLAPRTPEEERVLTDFARNYMTGRRWLCRFAHACVALGVAIGTIATSWDHIMGAAERLARIISHSH